MENESIKPSQLKLDLEFNVHLLHNTHASTHTTDATDEIENTNPNNEIMLKFYHSSEVPSHQVSSSCRLGCVYKSCTIHAKVCIKCIFLKSFCLYHNLQSDGNACISVMGYTLFTSRASERENLSENIELCMYELEHSLVSLLL